MAFSLRSPSFEHQGEIPAKHTCEGNDTAPALAWADAPAGTRSFALIVDDPDAPDPRAPKTTWVHWVLYNLPAATTALPEAATAADLPPGTQEGVNDFGHTGYGGPCPPIGRHRYFHKLYALDTCSRISRQAEKGGSGEGDKGTCAGGGATGRDVREGTLSA